MVTRITKDCFGTVISTLNKMKECVRCELLQECRSINWTASEHESTPTIHRAPLPRSSGDPEGAGTPADPAAGSPH